MKSLERMLLVPNTSGSTEIRCKILVTLSKMMKQTRIDFDCLKPILEIYVELKETKKLHYLTRMRLCACAASCLAFSNGGEDFLVNVILSMMLDDDYRVRLRAAHDATILFELFPESTTIFDDIYQEILPIVTSPSSQDYNVKPEELCTFLLSLEEICVTSPANEEISLLAILLHGSTLPTLVIAILKRISSKLAFHSVMELLEANISFLLQNWLLVANSDARQFPFTLLGVEDFDQFVRRYDYIVVPIFVFLCNKASLKVVSDICNSSAAQLIKSHFPAVFETTFPLYFFTDEKPKAISICENFLRSYISKQEYDKLIPSHIDVVIIQLLEVLSPRAEDLPPRYSKRSIKAVLSFLASAFKCDLKELLQKRSLVHCVLLHFRKKFAKLHRTVDREWVLEVLMFLMDCLEEGIFVASTYRDVLYTFANALRNSTVPEKSSQCLSQLVRTTVSTKPQVLIPSPFQILSSNFNFLFQG